MFNPLNPQRRRLPGGLVSPLTRGQPIAGADPSAPAAAGPPKARAPMRSPEDNVDELAALKREHDARFAARPDPTQPATAGPPKRHARDPRTSPTVPAPAPGGVAGPTDPRRPRPPTPSPADVQQAATDAIRGIGGAGGGKGDRHIRDGANDPNSPDYVGDLAEAQRRHDQEYAAAQQQLAASKAQALQTAAAKSGAAGFGLSGASAALQGDVGRAADRNAVLTLADLRGKQNDENFAELQREVALNQAEEDGNVDLNHDGFVAGHKVSPHGWGDGNVDDEPADNPKDQERQDRTKNAADEKAIESGMAGDGGTFSPYQGTIDDAHSLKDAGVEFRSDDARAENDNGQWFVVVRGTNGKLYKFAVDDRDLPDAWVNGGFTDSNDSDLYKVGASILQKEGLA